jgi:AsmA protein
MRKLLIGIVLLLLLAVVAVAAFLLIPSPLQKWAVERGASLATGRQVTFGDPFRLRAWPPLTVAAADIRVANAEWGRAAELARIDGLEASIDLLAFWRQNRVEVGRLIVTRPQVNLEIGEDGRQNWALGDSGPNSAEPGRSTRTKPIPGFVLGQIRIEDGIFTFDDRATKQSRRAEAIDLAITQGGADQPVTIDGRLTMAGKRATVAGSVARPQGVAAGETSPLVLDLRVPGGSAKFDGTVNTAAPAANGSTDIDISAPRELLTWLGQKPALPDGALKSASLQTKLDVTAERVALEDLRLRVDEILGRGRLSATLGEPPVVQGELAMGRLDVTPYVATGPAPKPTASSSTPQAAVLTQEWSQAPITLPLPLPVDADLRLQAESVKAGQVELGGVNARLQADRTQAKVTLDELQGYGGQVVGDAQAKPGSPATYGLNLNVKGVGLLAVLQSMTGRGRIDGRADLDLALAASGGSQREIVRSLGGNGKIVLRDGAVLGINIAGMLRQIMTLGLNPGATQQQRTDFAEAGGSFKVQNGILRNEDLYLRAPVLRLEGAGTVDLQQRTVDYRITPQLATTLEGQGASGTPALQAGIPFLVQGPFASPSVRFDLNGTLTGAVSSPADLARVAADLARSPQAVQLLRDKFDLLDQIPAPAAGKARDLIEGVLGGGSAPKGGEPKGAPNLGDAARGLLKSFGR